MHEARSHRATSPPRLEAILRRSEAGLLSAAVALMEMLIEAEDGDVVRSALLRSCATSPRARQILELMEANGDGCERIVAMLRSGVDSPPANGSIAEGVAFCRRLFDWSVGQSEEASVALYSLGNPALLAAATHEIATALSEWGVLGKQRVALDIGCGIGRMEVALAPTLGEIQAIDVSPEMIAVARRRCAEFHNVEARPSSGFDLRAFDDGRFDLVFAIDSFPYLVQSGMPLVAMHFAEAARVLRERGDFVILNFSYREDVAADRRDVAALADQVGFDVLVAGTTPFSFWDGTAFRLRRRA